MERIAKTVLLLSSIAIAVGIVIAIFVQAVSFEHLQHLIAQTGIVVFEIAGLLGILVYLAKRSLREIKGLVVLWGKLRKSWSAVEEEK